MVPEDRLWHAELSFLGCLPCFAARCLLFCSQFSCRETCGRCCAVLHSHHRMDGQMLTLSRSLLDRITMRMSEDRGPGRDCAGHAEYCSGCAAMLQCCCWELRDICEARARCWQKAARLLTERR